MSKAPTIVARAPYMPAMWSAVSMTWLPTGNLGAEAALMPAGAGPPSIGWSIGESLIAPTLLAVLPPS